MQTQSFHFETLSPQLSVCVSPAHKFGTDAFLLSTFARVRRRETACDLGTGCGIVALLWYRQPDDGPRHSFCVDIQPLAITQLNLTIQQHPFLQERITPVQQDLKKLAKQIAPHSIDVVTCNPPYKMHGHGILSQTDSDQLARHETACTLDDICASAARMLKFGGRLCVCQRPERIADVLQCMRSNGIEPKRLRFVQQREHTAPWLLLCEGRKGGKPFLQVEAPLIIEGPGGFSREMLNIYQKTDNLPPKGEN